RPSRRPIKLPASSSRTDSPASFIKVATSCFASRSSSVKEKRVTPPLGCFPTLPNVMRRPHRRSVLIISKRRLRCRLHSVGNGHGKFLPEGRIGHGRLQNLDCILSLLMGQSYGNKGCRNLPYRLFSIVPQMRIS